MISVCYRISIPFPAYAIIGANTALYISFTMDLLAHVSGCIHEVAALAI
jgi:hypothetical protein